MKSEKNLVIILIGAYMDGRLFSYAYIHVIYLSSLMRSAFSLAHLVDYF